MGSISIGRDNSPLHNVGVQDVEAPSILRSTLFLDHVGDVVLTLDSEGLSWDLLDSFETVSTLIP